MLVHTDNDAATTVEGAASKEHTDICACYCPIKPQTQRIRIVCGYEIYARLYFSIKKYIHSNAATSWIDIPLTNILYDYEDKTKYTKESS